MKTPLSLFLRASLIVSSLGLVVCCASTKPTEAGVDPKTDPSALAPPPAGQGFQFKTDAFPVAAGTEEQDCYFYKIRDLATAGGLDGNLPVNLHRVVLAQKEGSHHMNLFRVKTIVGLGPDGGKVQRAKDGVGECFKSPNWADWPLIANTQSKGSIDWTFPDGVANVFEPDEWIMLQTHFVNATSQKAPEGVGQVAVNFWTLPKDQVKAELGTVFATKQSIRICSKNPTPSFSGSCQVNSPNPVKIVGANAHFHGRGKQFDMYAWDGKSAETPPDSARFYRSQLWDDPPMLRSPGLDVALPPGGGVFYTCSYQWRQPEESAGGCKALNDFDGTKYKTPVESQDCCYTFGPIVEKNEHCNIFVYYYPKQDNVNCF